MVGEVDEDERRDQVAVAAFGEPHAEGDDDLLSMGAYRLDEWQLRHTGLLGHLLEGIGFGEAVAHVEAEGREDAADEKGQPPSPGEQLLLGQQ